jgi:hypothetical protein
MDWGILEDLSLSAGDGIADIASVGSRPTKMNNTQDRDLRIFYLRDGNGF